MAPLCSKIFGPNIFTKKIHHRGTIFGPNKIPNHLTNWMCRRRFACVFYLGIRHSIHESQNNLIPQLIEALFLYMQWWPDRYHFSLYIWEWVHSWDWPSGHRPHGSQPGPISWPQYPFFLDEEPSDLQHDKCPRPLPWTYWHLLFDHCPGATWRLADFSGVQRPAGHSQRAGWNLSLPGHARPASSLWPALQSDRNSGLYWSWHLTPLDTTECP